MRHPEQLGELDLFDHLPRDGLERGQREEQFGETAARLVLTVADVVLEVSVDLFAHASYAVRFVQALSVCETRVKVY